MVTGIHRPIAATALRVQTKGEWVALKNALEKRKGKRLCRQAVAGARKAAGIDQSVLVHMQGQS